MRSISPGSRRTARRLPFLLLCLIPAALLAQDPLAARLQPLVTAPPLDHAIAGVRVVELQTGRVVFDYRGNTPFTPASNTKLFTGAFALAKLGSNYRFHSSVRAAAEPDAAGIVHGSLTLVAGGDPTLSGRVYPHQSCHKTGDAGPALRELAQHVAGRGVKRIEGDIVGDDTRYPYQPYGPEWTVDDTQEGGEAPVSAWMIDDNVTGSGDDERGVRDPALAVAGRFRQALLDAGIEVQGQARARHRLPNNPLPETAGAVELASRTSPPFNQILQMMEKCSVNLHAESLLLEAAYQVHGDLLSRSQALDDARSFFASKGVPADQFEFHDGSGLSHANMVTPAAVTALLLAIQSAPWRDSFLQALSIGGVDGTLEHRFAGDPAAQQIRAKTGTLRHVAALSGYAGHRFAFSILVNQFFPGEHAAVVKAIDTIAVEIAQAAE